MYFAPDRHRRPDNQHLESDGLVTHTKARQVFPAWPDMASARLVLASAGNNFQIELYDGHDDKGRTFDRKVLNLKVYVAHRLQGQPLRLQLGHRPQGPRSTRTSRSSTSGAAESGARFPMIGHHQRRLKHFDVLSTSGVKCGRPIQRDPGACGRLEMKVLPGALRVICPFCRSRDHGRDLEVRRGKPSGRRPRNARPPPPPRARGLGAGKVGRQVDFDVATRSQLTSTSGRAPCAGPG